VTALDDVTASPADLEYKYTVVGATLAGAGAGAGSGGDSGALGGAGVLGASEVDVEFTPGVPFTVTVKVRDAQGNEASAEATFTYYGLEYASAELFDGATTPLTAPHYYLAGLTGSVAVEVADALTPADAIAWKFVAWCSDSVVAGGVCPEEGKVAVGGTYKIAANTVLTAQWQAFGDHLALGEFIDLAKAYLEALQSGTKSAVGEDGLPTDEVVDLIHRYDSLTAEEQAWLEANHGALTADLIASTEELRETVAEANHHDPATGITVEGIDLPWNVRLVAQKEALDDTVTQQFAQALAALGKDYELYSLFDIKLVWEDTVREAGSAGSAGAGGIGAGAQTGAGGSAGVGVAGAADGAPHNKGDIWNPPAGSSIRVTIPNALKDATTEFKFWHQHEAEPIEELAGERVAGAGAPGAGADAGVGEAGTTLAFNTERFSLFAVSYLAGASADSGTDLDGSLAGTGVDTAPVALWLLLLVTLLGAVLKVRPHFKGAPSGAP
jgi:hypothetical protein